MKRRRDPLRTPTGSDPAVVALVEAINATQLTVAEIADKAGVHASTIWGWLCIPYATPGTANLRAVLNALGYDLDVVRKQ